MRARIITPPYRSNDIKQVETLEDAIKLIKEL
jgi:hypothetical protein